MSQESKRYAETYGGMLGAVMPLIVMIGSMLVMVAFGMRSTKNFWAAGYLAAMTGFLVYKDKKVFQKALSTVSRYIFAFMIACFLFAGVMSKILTASHLVMLCFMYLQKSIFLRPLCRFSASSCA